MSPGLGNPMRSFNPPTSVARASTLVPVRMLRRATDGDPGRCFSAVEAPTQGPQRRVGPRCGQPVMPWFR